MRILSIDIETTPNLAHVWGLWQQNVGLPQLLAPTDMLCYAAKWYGEPKMYFDRVDPDGDRSGMVATAFNLLDQADVVMHYNGRRFDVPHLNREFLLHGFNPPSPFKQIDLMRAVKKQFSFPSYKLDHVSQRLGLKGKVKHAGHELWIKCMANDETAWRKMKTYNKQDVRLLEQLYDVLQPWIPTHPNTALHNSEPDPDGYDQCPACGSTLLNPQGFAYTATSKFQRFQCGQCGKWSRSGKRVGAVDVREVVS